MSAAFTIGLLLAVYTAGMMACLLRGLYLHNRYFARDEQMTERGVVISLFCFAWPILPLVLLVINKAADDRNGDE